MRHGKPLVAAVAAVLLAAVAGWYVLQSRQVPSRAQDVPTAFDEPGLYVVAESGVVSVPAAEPGGRRRAAGLRCDRFHADAGVGVCLAAAPGLVPTTEVTVMADDGTELDRAEVAGVPNRARVSGSGRMVAWTTFVVGDSYADGNFSTRTSILDLETGHLIVNMETIQLYLGGERHHAADVNYWGVTFTDDDNVFYATVATGGRTHLVRGDLDRWAAEDVRENVECPSLSPDGTRIAFKERTGDGARPWRLAVLDLGTGRETELPGTDGVDDQALWLDGDTLAYGSDGGVWAVAADGSAEPRLLAEDAASPSIVGGWGA
ncbi:TolB family protein [Glycomyces salinus]|uniref:TolB family protein n=1 Tax=Glycomyces salinus TaxID=980294 RepID=UPI0018EAFEBF|nr:PD40 domain-containing protein [Glycomyces salinus]